MKTPEQARKLWCPMARVAQAGNADIHASYNRSLTRTHVPARLLKVKDANEFNLGDEAIETQDALILHMSTNVSIAAMCLGDGCAMWRVAQPDASVGYCGIAGRPEVSA